MAISQKGNRGSQVLVYDTSHMPRRGKGATGSIGEQQYGYCTLFCGSALVPPRAVIRAVRPIRALTTGLDPYPADLHASHAFTEEASARLPSGDLPLLSSALPILLGRNLSAHIARDARPEVELRCSCAGPRCDDGETRDMAVRAIDPWMFDDPLSISSIFPSLIHTSHIESGSHQHPQTRTVFPPSRLYTIATHDTDRPVRRIEVEQPARGFTRRSGTPGEGLDQVRSQVG